MMDFDDEYVLMSNTNDTPPPFTHSVDSSIITLDMQIFCLVPFSISLEVSITHCSNVRRRMMMMNLLELKRDVVIRGPLEFPPGVRGFLGFYPI